MGTDDGRVKLTESGARSLRGWLDREGVTLAQLADVLALPHAMAATRAVRRQGLLSLEQVGRLVAFARGELTAEMLVGLARAPGVPAFPFRAVVAPPAAPVALPPSPTVVTPAPAGAVDVEAVARSMTAQNLEVLRHLRDHARAEGVRLHAAELLLEVGEGRPRQREPRREVEGPVVEQDLIDKFARLIADAKVRQATPPAAATAAPVAPSVPTPPKVPGNA